MNPTFMNCMSLNSKSALVLKLNFIYNYKYASYALFGSPKIITLYLLKIVS